MIDLHCHVLPAVDDGAADDFESRGMLERWAELGCDELVATPHLSGSLQPIYRAEVGDAFERTNAVAREHGIVLRSGFEIMLHPDLPDRLDAGEPLSLGGSTAVLVEVPFLQWPAYSEEVIFGVQTVGFQPVLAHPERYVAVQQDPGLAFALAGRGVVMQLTYASFAGVFGRAAQRTAELIVRSEVHVILASDAHSNGQRMTTVPRASNRVMALVGEARLHQMTTEVPAALLTGDVLPDLAPVDPADPGSGRMGMVKRLFSVPR